MCMKDKIKKFFTFKTKRAKWKIKNGFITLTYDISPLAISGRDERNRNFTQEEAYKIAFNMNLDEYDHRRVNLTWYQRSVDVPLGLPFNIASYGLLLILLSRHFGIKPGKLTGMLNDVHYYENQQKGVNTILSRYNQILSNGNYLTDAGETISISNLPNLVDVESEAKSIFEFNHNNFKLEGYTPLPKIEIPIAV